MGYTVSWRQYHFTDFTYATILRILPTLINKDTPFRIHSWGFCLGTPDDPAPIERVASMCTFIKTNRLPYTKDVMKALILMVEYGAADQLTHDDDDMTWYLQALEEVHTIHPLASYEQQRAYFLQKS